MSTPSSRPPSHSSGAIRTGADLILTLFEEDAKKREDINLKKLRDLEALFKQFRGYAAMAHAKIALKAREVEAELEKTKEDLSKARLDYIETYAVWKKAEAEATQAKSHLDALRLSLHAFGMTYSDDLVLKQDDKTAEAISQLFDTIEANEKALPKYVADSATMRFVISTFSQYVEFHKDSVNEWEEKYRTLERERDLAMRVLRSLPNSVAAARAELLAPPTPSSLYS